MNRFQTLLGCSAFALLSSAHFATADVTPNDVWQDWRDHIQSIGYSLTAKESTSGNTLTVSDLRLDLAMDPDQGDMSVTLGSIGFAQNDDGSVTVLFPPVMPVSVSVSPATGQGEPVTMTLTINQSAQDMVVSGTPTNMTSSYSAGMVGLTLDQLTVGSETVGPENAKMAITMQDVQSRTDSKLASMRDYDQTATIGSATYEMRFKDPHEPAIATVQGTSANLGFKANGILPLALAQVRDTAGLLRAGMDVAGTVTAGNSTMTLNIEDPVSGDMAIAMAAESGTLAVETSADGFSYAGTREGMTVSVQPPQFPFLLSFAMDNAAFNLSAPVMRSDAPQNFALGLNLTDFTMSDLVWGMLNPQGTLPRDPATVALDMTGTATLLADYLDMQNADQMSDAMDVPAKPESVKLNSLIVDALGARLTGYGAATFDNSGTDTQDGTLKPTGAVDLKLVGGNTLINSLVEAGLLPDQMAMGARMVMGMFTIPGDGEDTLETKIEFTRSGAILANGQRIK